MSKKLKNFFVSINKNKEKLTEQVDKTGKSFEKTIQQELENSGILEYKFPKDKKLYTEKDKIILNFVSKIKTSILESNEVVFNDLSKISTDFTNIFIYQPYGKQQFPDFLIFTEKRVLPIEIKFSSSDSKKPMWNSNGPKKYSIYLFGSFKEKDINFFMGKDIMSEKDRILIDEWIKSLHKFTDDWVNKHKIPLSESLMGFYPYPRVAFDQTKKHNKDALLDYFKNEYRKEFEDNVLQFVSKEENIIDDEIDSE